MLSDWHVLYEYLTQIGMKSMQPHIKLSKWGMLEKRHGNVMYVHHTSSNNRGKIYLRRLDRKSVV